ncbi:hypothetical protein [Flagellimonas pacifica]|uniref:Lipoprotein n=1 Tax=Flagellimonas pacifica TaxID=1247520 RepID=A0A285MT30_9FLAO|nr:hypothetical protein [Allomuricauda parva]SNZ00332.1 hypothetical protein SAMN06265377_2152 [Allomuricauda parva]
MRKFFFPTLLICAMISCSDGELQIETIDFDSVTAESCNPPQADSENLLFKLNEDEALILELESGILNKGTLDETVTSTSAVPSKSKLTYRFFSEKVTSNYFCDDVPPATPTVVNEIKAESGTVTIETKADADKKNYIHTIRLSDISFVRDNGERITNLTISEFGEVTTAIPN